MYGDTDEEDYEEVTVREIVRETDAGYLVIPTFPPTEAPAQLIPKSQIDLSQGMEYHGDGRVTFWVRPWVAEMKGL